jgi:hypothetical protein
VWLVFLLKFSDLQCLQTETFFASLFATKIKRDLPLCNKFFWQHPEVFIVYAACPGDDADKFSLPLDQNFFLASLFVK